jgi:cell division protease FtsH
MSEKLGHVALESDQRTFLTPNPVAGGPRDRDFSDETATAVDEEIRAIVEAAFARTVKMLTERRDLLETTARTLLEKETLDETELKALLDARANVKETAYSSRDA